MANDALYFAVKSIGMSTRCGRKPQSLLDAARHNLREIQTEHGADGHIDPKRIAQNVLMQGPPTAAEVVKQADELFARYGVVPADLRKDYCQAIELVFSLPVGSDVEAASYFERCLRWTGNEYALPVLLATAHHDESAKHLHVLLLPLQNGGYVGSEPVAKPITKQKLESFFQKVAGPSGLRRSNARLHGMAKAWGVQAVLTKIEVDGFGSCSEALWPIVRAAIERDPTPFMQALQIDANSIRPSPAKAETTRRAKAIGFVSPGASPIGFQSAHASDQNLSCVGFPDQRAAKSPKLPVRSHALLPMHTSPDLQAQSSPTATSSLPTRDEENGITRDRDGFCQTPPAWLE